MLVYCIISFAEAIKSSLLAPFQASAPSVLPTAPMLFIIKYLCPSAEAVKPELGPFLFGSTIASIGSNVFVGIVSVSTVNSSISSLAGCNATVPTTSGLSGSSVFDTLN